MEQFNLEKYLENPSRKVVTRDGREVEILKTDFRGYKQIIGVVKNRDNKDDEVDQWDGQGNFRSLFGESKYDLFFADEEEELTEFEKSIQYVLGCYACKQIELGDKADNIKLYAETLLDLARKEIEKENSEFKPKFIYNEKDYSKLGNKLIEFRNNTPLFSVSYRDGEGRKVILHYEKEILDLVRKEVEKEITKEVEQKAINHTYVYQNGYENGKYDALKDLPKWKKAKKDEELDCHVAIQQDDRVVLSDFVQKDEYYITLDVLKKLPKEE